MKSTDTPKNTDRFLRRPEVQSLTGLAVSTLYASIKAGTFPAPIRLSARAVAWRESDLIEWQQTRPAAGSAARHGGV